MRERAANCGSWNEAVHVDVEGPSVSHAQGSVRCLFY
jgi:hypothetical protein